MTDFDVEKDYYRILHLERDATPDQIKKAFFTLAKRYHPDTKRSLHDADVEEVFTEKYREINEAHEILSDALKRHDYDEARDRRENGTVPPHEEPQSPPQPRARPMAEPEPESEVVEGDLPPVIRSDRGLLFVRKGAHAPYIGEDGARYSVSGDGRIRRISGDGFLTQMRRPPLYGDAAEVLVALMGRFLQMLARVLAGLLIHYPLWLSMMFVHRSPYRRMHQERAYIGSFVYGVFVALNALVLLGVILLVMQGAPELAPIALAFHLITAALVALDLRAPYLALLEREGLGTSVGGSSTLRLARRLLCGVIYAVQVGTTLWLIQPYLAH